MKTFAAVSACALTLLIAGTASAAEYRIPFGDLDLSSPQGAAQFDRRVSRASRIACNGGTALEQARCMGQFRADARGGLPAQRRDDYARGRSDRSTL